MLHCCATEAHASLCKCFEMPKSLIQSMDKDKDSRVKLRPLAPLDMPALLLSISKQLPNLFVTTHYTSNMRHISS